MEQEALELGELAYDTYVKAAGGRSLVTGVSLPEWYQVDTAIKDAWQAAAEAVWLSAKDYFMLKDVD